MIRPATADDLEQILQLVRELAEFEEEPDAAVGTLESYTAAMFPPRAARRSGVTSLRWMARSWALPSGS
ncbi:hypothetical protein [Ornithinimicrobium sp. INDO-MA30-4]|uniref:hypothetical protein n=1 Tax=Ornithinimicrobium sp. INDO-MA30-4 TaxID=2908651 RepID=UPI0028833706|nr:hypothetical protein [Ornithinimicrobium sp. INDO-MA30-4]